MDRSNESRIDAEVGGWRPTGDTMLAADLLSQVRSGATLYGYGNVVYIGRRIVGRLEWSGDDITAIRCGDHSRLALRPEMAAREESYAERAARAKTVRCGDTVRSHLHPSYIATKSILQDGTAVIRHGPFIEVAANADIACWCWRTMGCRCADNDAVEW